MLLESSKEEMDEFTTKYETEKDLLEYLWGIKNKTTPPQNSRLIMENNLGKPKIIMLKKQKYIAETIINNYPDSSILQQIFKEKPLMFDDLYTYEKYKTTPLKQLRVIYEYLITNNSIKAKEELKRLNKQYDEQYNKQHNQSHQYTLLNKN